jgi:hypothetical protein
MIAVQAVLLCTLLPASGGESAADSFTPAVAGDALKEFSLGRFQVRNFQTPGEDLLLRFGVCLTVDDRNKEQLERAFRRHEQRVREAVGIAVRKADLDALSEPSLGTLKRRLRVAIQAAMQTDEPHIDDVLMPDFTIARD